MLKTTNRSLADGSSCFLLLFLLSMLYPENMTKIIFLLLFLLITPLAYAQSDIANVYDISDREAKDGDILVITPEKGITRTNIPYDIHLFGVLQDNPLVAFKKVDRTGKTVARSGMTQVNVTNKNGPIKAGDGITSSEIPGYGMKATISGHIIGVATADFSPSADGKGQVTVALKIEYADLTTARSANRLLQYIGTAFFKNIQDPQGFGLLLKSLIAGLIMIISLVFSFIIISRSIPKAIEAIGRNPLARRSIILSIGLNIGFAIATSLIGIIAALIILRL